MSCALTLFHRRLRSCVGHVYTLYVNSSNIRILFIYIYIYLYLHTIFCCLYLCIIEAFNKMDSQTKDIFSVLLALVGVRIGFLFEKMFEMRDCQTQTPPFAVDV